ncbi:conserved hypothetical protein [Ricinus communis]|uniref:Uncharacterized protein n=1 Tax=Ricinus communis TaxID=3988 RepID=B9TLY8_RICCO|nr:conserved hypothetical protein [Ricinus communis]
MACRGSERAGTHRERAGPAAARRPRPGRASLLAPARQRACARHRPSERPRTRRRAAARRVAGHARRGPGRFGARLVRCRRYGARLI